MSKNNSNTDQAKQSRKTGVSGSEFYKIPLRFIAILLIKYLQKKYKYISINKRGQQSSQVLAKLKLIQSILYFFKSQFNAWGYFHPSCCWSKEDEIFFNKLFPNKDFQELDVVIWHNPEAVSYYHNKIYELSRGKSPIYEIAIKNQLQKWKCWN